MLKKLLLVCVAAAFTLPLAAQSRDTFDPAAAIKRLAWRAVGPANTGGRVTAIEGIPGDPTTFYVGTADGGIFKTTNGGTTFRPVFNDQPVQSIGALGVAPSDHHVVWAGTGEGNPRNSVSFGNGVYRTTDGGATWTHLSLADTERIARLRVSPRDPDVAYVAALGHEWGPNEERGLFKTIDGGKTWNKILYLDPDTGCSDVELDSSNPRIVYAAMYTYRRRPWRFDGGGGRTGLYKSTDGGATWTKLTGGIPDKPMDRVGIAVAPSQPQTVYIVTEIKDEGSLFRSDDGGESWRVVHKNPQINMRPFYFGVVRVDPVDAERVYVLSGSLYVSRDGGRTFDTAAQRVHPDHHALWIDPTNPYRMLNGNDGGVYRSWDRAETWEYFNTLPISQFYHVAYDMRRPYWVCGGLQDNFNWCGPSATTLNEGIRRDDWITLLFGDGFFVVPDPTSPNLVYNDTQGGVIALTDTRSGNQRSVHPYPAKIGSAGGGIADYKYRFNWNSPIVISPHDPKTVYFGGNVVFKTTNGGETWEAISPDLTTNDKSKQQSSGGSIVTDNTAAEFHCTILTIAESPGRAGVIWVGTDDGNVQVTRDGGKTWTNVVSRIQGLPSNAWIPSIEASHVDPGTAYVAADRHQDDDFAPYAFKTTDYGQTWTALRGDLPAKGYVHVIREDPKTRDLLYAGTELGVFASWDGGVHWVPIRNNMPAVAVRDLQIHPRDNDLIAGTHGRGAWILDDLTPLQTLTRARGAELHAFDARPAVRWQMSNTNVFTSDRHFAGPNPPYGALISYYLRSDAKDGATIAVTDGDGKPVRQIRNAPGQSGVMRVAWDLRYDGPTPATSERGGGGAGGGGGGGGRGGGGGGPLAGPGDYRVTIRAAGREATTTVRVQPDPRIQVSDEDLRAQRDALLALRDLTSRVNAIIDRTADLQTQLDALSRALDKETSPDADAVRRAVKAVREAIDEERGPLTRPAPMGYRYPPGLREELGSLTGGIGGSTAAPTRAQLGRLDEMRADVDKAAAAINAILTKTIPDLNARVGSLPRVVAGAPIK